MGALNKFLGLIYFLVALYLINSALGFVNIPEGISVVEIFVFLIAAVILGIKAFKTFFKQAVYY